MAKTKTKPAPPGDNKRLPEIAKAIRAIEKALDKVALPEVLKMGKLLHEASETCEHGEYMKWVANEFEWSHQTSLNYRNLYDFSKFPNVGNLARLNMSLSTLYSPANFVRPSCLFPSASRRGRSTFFSRGGRNRCKSRPSLMPLQLPPPPVLFFRRIVFLDRPRTMQRQHYADVGVHQSFPLEEAC
jgi:hypothetical protein